MNKKLLILAMATVLMLVTVSMLAAAGNKTVEKKESPLFKFRTNQFVKENLKERFQFKSMRERIFFNFGFLSRDQYENELGTVALTILSCPLYCCK